MPDGSAQNGEARQQGWIGRARRRREDAALLTGAGRFAADLPRPPGCLHAAFARAAEASGVLRQVDLSAALGLPGVVAAFAGADCVPAGEPAVNRFFPDLPASRFLPLARDRVAAAGQPLAIVLAESAMAALDGAEAVLAELEPLDPEATEPAFAGQWRSGDAEAAFAAAAHVVRAGIRHSRLAPAAMEPRAALAVPREGGGLTIHLSTQTPHRALADLAAILGLDPAAIRVVAGDVGGSFGAKASLHPEEAAVAWAALRLGRPVSWQATRSEEMLTATQGRGQHLRGELALDAGGRATALRAVIETPLGHRLPYSAAVPGRNAARCLPGPYAVPAVDIALAGHFDHRAPMGIYRGAGRPEAAMLMERLMEAAGRATGLGSEEIRRRNLLPPEALPHRTPTGEVLDSGDYPALLARVLEMGAGLREACAARRARGELVGLGLALYVEPCGQGWESARLTLAPDGRILAATGATAQGQGRETAYAQIVADALRVADAEVEVLHGDTATTPPGIGALASRSTGIGGGALMQAAAALEAKALPVAARLLQSPPEALRPAPGGFAVAGAPGRQAGWAAIAAATPADPLEAEAVFHAPGEAWACGAVLALVAIEAETGIATVERLDWVDDIGTVVNPMLAKGQMLGGLLQGVGEALLERVAYDEAGQLLSGSFMDYAMPRADDAPLETRLGAPAHPSPAGNSPLGAKGVGEAGCIGVPAAVVNAVADALAARGVTLDSLALPLTQESIWRALNSGGSER
ncbi:xanthine dehydrogenase family protein molybdopterin-binding subunit [Roseomonas sp. NAR14]|uniref:Xanthine dehydrogenase family protein molybdopterin-binding subunit n=1 Tax=Roseomonas acroporae TaxID=2937791 RepID=A0A9X1YAB6_9PROT|nr:xanthine dehydrogenase family protein molybdopterin-binding subunit [Roseomonas acroporae]MCK8787054.1 xanthine dehydrogenase family protein molybdopterin-binding subunit [Roseomonas acroporae]